MHILLTDITTCPVCGPRHGLILRADELIERRVRTGALGCPNCRRQYPITHGVAVLSTGDPSIAPTTAATAVDADAAIRIAALLGLGDGSGFALLLGPAARSAGDVAALAPGFEIVADATWAPESNRVSRVHVGSAIPFYAEKLRGVWLSGARIMETIAESARVLHPLGRLVLEGAPPEARTHLTDAALDVLAEQNGIVLASRR